MHTSNLTPARRMLIAALALFVLLGLAMDWWKRRAARAPAGASRIVASQGLAADPAISPDAGFVAYAADREGGALQIWVQPVAGGEPWRVTSGGADHLSPAFSPDGRLLAYRAEDAPDGAVWVAPVRGGEPRRIAEGGRDPQFSPDGKRIAWWVKNAAGGQVWVSPAEGGQARRICPECSAASYPLWSPDGRRLLFSGRKGAQADWFAAPVDGGPPTATGAPSMLRLQDVEGDPAPTAWVRDRILFSAQFEGSGGVWSIPISPDLLQCTSTAVRITQGKWDRHGSAAANGAMVYESSSLSAHIWALPARQGASEPERLAEAEPGRAQFSVSADGLRVARFRGRAISMRELVSGRERTVGAPDASGGPVLSPDGTRVAWGVHGSLYVAPFERGVAQVIGNGRPLDWRGDRILAQGWSNSLLLYHAAGARQRPRDVIRRSGGVYQPRFSPDGRALALHTRASRGRRVWILPLRDGEAPPDEEWIPVTEEDGGSRDPAWSEDGAVLYYLSERDGYRCIWAQPLDRQSLRPRGEAFPVRHFHGVRLSLTNPQDPADTRLAFAAGKLFFVLYERRGEIWKTSLP